MSYRRSDRKLRPPWIQTQLDQGYRPYSFYVEYQRTTPIASTRRRSDSPVKHDNSSTATTTNEKTNDGRDMGQSGQQPLIPLVPAGSSSSSSSVMLGGYTPGLVETSIVDDGLAILSSDRGARMAQGNTAIWYRTGASGPAIINDNTRYNNRQRELTTEDQNTDRTMDHVNQPLTSHQNQLSSTYDLITESDLQNLEINAQSQRAVLLSTSETEEAELDVNLQDRSQDLSVTVSMSEVETPTSLLIHVTNTLGTSEITTTHQHIESKVLLTTIQETGDHVTTVIADQRSNINVTDDHQVSDQLDEDTIVFSSNIPQTREDALHTDTTTTTTHDVTEPGFSLDVSLSEHETTNIPEQFTDTTDVRDDDVTIEMIQNKSPTAKKSDLIPCSTKHRSKSKKPSRRRNRNRKRTRVRTAPTSAPPSLSMGYGINSTGKYPLYPLPNPYHPQVHVTQPALISSADHSFARNSTFTISGLSSGEVTGIAIGCIIAFWIILGPLVCIICRMRDKAKEKRREREQEDSMSHTLIEEMIRMELARGRAKRYRTNVDDEREIERLPLQGDCCGTCNSNGSCVINPQDYVIGNRYMEYTPVSLMPAPPSDSDKDYIINKTYVDSLDIKLSARDTNL